MKGNNNIFYPKINRTFLIIKFLLLGLILLWIEISLGLVWGISPRVPALTLLLIMYCGLRGGTIAGILAGVWLGFIGSIIRYEVAGASTLVGVMIGFCAGLFSGKISLGQYVGLILIVGLLLLLAEFLSGTITYILFNFFLMPDWLWIVVNMGCCLPLFFMFEVILRPGARSRYLMQAK
ncbi:MAG: hypothetical protein N2246_03280 [Candidatus Sumerlaeia bacterium]|nr:hypothetical protein [Candidatus Sumerlaeia bacterium]